MGPTSSEATSEGIGTLDLRNSLRNTQVPKHPDNVDQPMYNGKVIDVFSSYLLYFRPSWMLPIDLSRREFQNPLGEIKFGGVFFFSFFGD